MGNLLTIHPAKFKPIIMTKLTPTNTNKLLLAIIIAAVIGLAASMYLSIVKLSDIPIYCTPGLGDCDAVNASRWAILFGLPLALYGVAMYLVILLVILLKDKVKYIAQYEKFILFGISCFGFFFSLYLLYLELFVIKAICQWCMVSAISITTIFIISLIRATQPPEQAIKRRK